jgi:PKHD-type hydroxylase
MHLSLPAALTPEDCAQLITLAQAHQMKDAGLVGGTSAPAMRRAKIAWLDDIPDAAWAMDRMIAHVARANRDHFGFDITDFGESAQIARYDAAGADHFDWHADIGRGPQAARRKLTIVVQLSDPATYEGGTLELRPDSSIIAADATPGTATLFPSFVLHRVTPLTKGTRWSLTLWAHGPAFR